MIEQPEQPSSLFEMEIDGNTQNHMLTVSRWAKTIAITAFITISLLVLSFVISFENVPVFSFGFLSGGMVVILVIGAYIILWMYFLFRSAILIRDGIFNRSNTRLAEGFKTLKIFFTFSLIASVLSIISTLFTVLN